MYSLDLSPKRYPLSHSATSFDGLSMINDIDVLWFPGEPVVDWYPFFPGVVRDPARGLEIHQLDLVDDKELSGQIPVTNHGIPSEVVRDHLRLHLDCTLFCDLVGK